MASRGRSAKSKGSAYERKVAGILGGRRAPLSGAVGGGDIWKGELADTFLLELKRRAKLPALITSALLQAQAGIPTGSQLRPAVICAEDYGESIFVCYLGDLLNWTRGLKEQPGSYKLKEYIRNMRKVLDEMEGTIG